MPDDFPSGRDEAGRGNTAVPGAGGSAQGNTDGEGPVDSLDPEPQAPAEPGLPDAGAPPGDAGARDAEVGDAGAAAVDDAGGADAGSAGGSP